jgi:hypothetical protein
MASPKAPLEPKVRRTGKVHGNRPEARAGRETGKGFGPSRDPKTGFFEEASALKEGSGRVARPSGEAAIRKGISGGFGLAGFLGRRRLRPESFGRATGEVSASMRALETARLRPGWIRQGRRGGISIPAKQPDGNR